MNVVIRVDGSANIPIRNGWKAAFEIMGYHVHMWDHTQKPIFDLFHEIQKPVDIFIGTTYDLDDATEKIIRQNPEMKVILYCSAWGKLTEEISKKYPIVYIQEQEKRRLEKLKRETGKPDFVFLHVTPKYLESNLGGWRSIGIEPVGVLNAADHTVYSKACYKPEYHADVATVSGYWQYKAHNLDKYLVKLCNESNYNIKIFGNTPWPVPQYLGQIAWGEDAHVFMSASIIPNISEPHSYEYPDIVERVFKVPLSSGFLISDNVDLSEVFPPNIVPQFSSYKEFLEILNHYLNEPGERYDLIISQKECIMNGHLYQHRILQILDKLGMLNKHIKKEENEF